MDVDNPLPRLVANRVIKTKRKKGTTSVRRQLQSFARDLTAHQTPRLEKSLPFIAHQSHYASRAHRFKTQHKTYRRDPQDRFPQALTRSASTPNDPGQWHLATNHQDNRLLSPQVSINHRGRDLLSDISLNATNVYLNSTDSAQYMQDVDSSPGLHPRFLFPPSSQVHRHYHVHQQQKTGESISDSLRLKQTGISTISALLHYNNKSPATTIITTQDLLQGSESNRTELVSVIAGIENFRFQ